jgi:DNA-directed RNA polymerase subunit L
LKNDINLICFENPNCFKSYERYSDSPKLRKNLWEAVLDRLGACFKINHPQDNNILRWIAKKIDINNRKTQPVKNKKTIVEKMGEFLRNVQQALTEITFSNANKN